MRLSRIALAGLLMLMAAASASALVIKGTGGPDTLRGTAKADHISGRGGNDHLFDLAGNDVLVGGPGRDSIQGGAGVDRIQVRDGERDVVSCGAGRDTVVGDQRDFARADCEVVLRKTRGAPTPPVAEAPLEPEPAPDPSPPPPLAVAVTPGSYKGATSVGNYVFFDVAADRSVAAFRVNDFRRVCDGPLYIYCGLDLGAQPRLRIQPDGTFSAIYNWDGGWAIDPGTPAKGGVRITG
jgi:hypothetical protein